MTCRINARMERYRRQHKDTFKNLQWFDEKELCWSFDELVAQWPKKRILDVLFYDRVSYHTQTRNMEDRRPIIEKLLRACAKKHGVKLRIRKEDFCEVCNGRPGWLNKRNGLKRAARIAGEEGYVLVCISVDRLIRPRAFRTETPFINLLADDVQQLQAMFEGIIIAAYISPGTKKSRVRGIYSEWGQQAKGNPGGRPPESKKMSQNERLKKFKPFARKWSQKGYCGNDIRLILSWNGCYVSRRTACRWVEDISAEKRAAKKLSKNS